MDERRYTVVVGVDASPSGQEALRWALGEARARRGRLRAIHAWMSPYDYQLEVYFRPDEAALRAAAQRRLDEALAEVDIGAVDIEAELIEGDPRHVLVDAALLVIGSRGHVRVAEVVLRSVSTFCMHDAPGARGRRAFTPHGAERNETPVGHRFNATVRAPSTPELVCSVRPWRNG
jgi:nucleotide-binding universal stress UspA family protein